MNQDEFLDKQWGDRYDEPKPEKFEDDKQAEQDEQVKFAVEKAIKDAKDGAIFHITDIHNYLKHKVKVDKENVKIDLGDAAITFKKNDSIGIISIHRDTLSFPLSVRAIYNQLNEFELC